MDQRQVESSESQIAERVRAFHDAHTYPPPAPSLEEHRRAWADELKRRAEFHLFFPDRPYRTDQNILVAGCGTSQAARHALRHPGAKVVGVDVSKTSVRHTEELKRRHDLANLEIHLLPLERVGELGRRFNLIVCTGVLHHLSDPDAGLAALRDALEPDGALHLMVYAPYGRSGIYMIQEYARRLGVGHTEREIEDLAATLMAMPLGHPLAWLLGQSPDFRRKDALADALLNPQDRAYTVPQLFAFLERGGLDFARWRRQAPYLPCCGALAETPHSARLSALPALEQYAAVELFRGTMLRHSLVAHHAAHADRRRIIRFDGEDWLSYVPIRAPDAVTVRKRAPPGAAAALINRAHADPDLALPVDAAELRLIEAVDGRRTVEAITSGAGAPQERARRLFERLWNYDQVVFDASATAD